VFSNFILKNVLFMRYFGKILQSWLATDEKSDMRIACWIPVATNAHPQYVLVIAFPLQQWLHERAPMLRFTYIACHAVSLITVI
jgi:hypothetical protein